MIRILIWICIAIVASACSFFLYAGITTRQHVADKAVRVAQDTNLLDLAVGLQLQRDLFVTGRLLSGTDYGTADLEIPVHGNRGHGMLSAWLQNGFAGWHVCSMVFVTPDQKRIVVVPDQTSKCERE